MSFITKKNFNRIYKKTNNVFKNIKNSAEDIQKGREKLIKIFSDEGISFIDFLKHSNPGQNKKFIQILPSATSSFTQRLLKIFFLIDMAVEKEKNNCIEPALSRHIQREIQKFGKTLFRSTCSKQNTDIFLAVYEQSSFDQKKFICQKETGFLNYDKENNAINFNFLSQENLFLNLWWTFNLLEKNTHNCYGALSIKEIIEKELKNFNISLESLFKETQKEYDDIQKYILVKAVMDIIEKTMKDDPYDEILHFFIDKGFDFTFKDYLSGSINNIKETPSIIDLIIKYKKPKWINILHKKNALSIFNKHPCFLKHSEELIYDGNLPFELEKEIFEIQNEIKAENEFNL